KEFTTSGITVNLVGFNVVPRERANLIKNFRDPILKLPLGGKFYEVEEAKGLQTRLRELMKQRLSFRLERIGGRAVSEEAWDVGDQLPYPWHQIDPDLYTI